MQKIKIQQILFPLSDMHTYVHPWQPSLAIRSENPSISGEIDAVISHMVFCIL